MQVTLPTTYRDNGLCNGMTLSRLVTSFFIAESFRLAVLFILQIGYRAVPSIIFKGKSPIYTSSYVREVGCAQDFLSSSRNIHGT